MKNCCSRIVVAAFFFLGSISLQARDSSSSGDSVSYKEAGLALHKRITRNFPDHPKLADSLAWQLYGMVQGRRDSLEGLALYDLGEAAYYSGDYDKAGTFYGKSIDVFEFLGSFELLIDLYNNLGLTHYFKDRYNESLNAYMNSVKLIKEHGTDLDLAQGLHNIALVHDRIGNIKSAENYFESSLTLFQDMEALYEEASLCNDFAGFWIDHKEYDRCIKLYDRALEIFRDLGDTKEENTVLFNLGSVYYHQGRLKKAESYFLKAQSYFERSMDKESLLSVYSELGELHFKQGNGALAVPLLNKVEKMSLEMGRNYIRHKNLYSLYRALKSVGRYPEAIETLEVYHQLKDSLAAQSQSASKNRVDIALEKELLDQELDLFRSKVRERTLMTLMVALFVLLLLAVGIIYVRNQRVGREREKSLLQNRMLRMQMNPHFIFNALTFLQGYLLDGKTKEAEDYLGDVALLIRRTLESSFSEFVSVKEEFSFLRNYFKVQCRRFDDKIAYELISDINVDESRLMIPPMLTQPFIENVFEHAQLQNQANPLMVVSIKQLDKGLEVSVEDNGVGINTSKLSDKENSYQPRAIKMVEERLGLLNKMYKGGRADLEITDLSLEGRQGTRVRFWLPLILQPESAQEEKVSV
jgi:tetratricopeptide (TPR) repeat protein